MPHQDLFPAYVVIATADFPTPIEEISSAPPTPGTAQITIARVVVSNTRIIVAQDGPQGPQIVYDEAIDPESHFKSASPLTLDSYVTTATGVKIVFKKDTACGCGSRLRSWNPTGGISTSIKDPTE